MDELVSALSDLGAHVHSFDGVDRCVVDILGNETLEIYKQPNHEPFMVLEAVNMDGTGGIQRTIVGVVYGLALVPVMVREYAHLRKRVTAS